MTALAGLFAAYVAQIAHSLGAPGWAQVEVHLADPGAYDFASLEAPAGLFDAVTAFYSIVHVPRDEQPGLLGRIRGWLKPGGLFLASMSHVGGDDRTDEWLGVEMFFSGFDAETNRRLVREAGFELLEDELVWMREPEPQGEVAFLWVLARKPG